MQTFSVLLLNSGCNKARRGLVEKPLARAKSKLTRQAGIRSDNVSEGLRARSYKASRQSKTTMKRGKGDGYASHLRAINFADIVVKPIIGRSIIHDAARLFSVGQRHA